MGIGEFDAEGQPWDELVAEKKQSCPPYAMAPAIMTPDLVQRTFARMYRI